MKPWVDRDDVVKVRWYRVPWGTEAVPYWHVWGHPDWDPDRPKEANNVGVIPYPAGYDKGAHPDYVGTRGRVCGSADAWAGLSGAPLVYDVQTNVARCCGVPPFMARPLSLVPAMQAGVGVLAVVESSFPETAVMGVVQTWSPDPAPYPPGEPGLSLVGDSPFPAVDVLALVPGVSSSGTLSIGSDAGESEGSLAVVISSVPFADVLVITGSATTLAGGLLALEGSAITGEGIIAITGITLPDDGMLLLLPDGTQPFGSIGIVSAETGIGEIALLGDVAPESTLSLESGTVPGSYSLDVGFEMPFPDDEVLGLDGDLPP